MSGGMVAFRVLCLVVLLAGSEWGLAGAGETPAKAIHEQIKELKVQEKAALKVVHEWYTQFMKHDRLDEKVIERERQALRAQEAALLKVALVEADRKAIRAHFDDLVAMLKVGHRLDQAQFAQLKVMRQAHETYVRAAYRSQIQHLEMQAKAAAKGKKK
jgi:hypothetical protein